MSVETTPEEKYAREYTTKIYDIIVSKISDIEGVEANKQAWEAAKEIACETVDYLFPKYIIRSLE